MSIDSARLARSPGQAFVCRHPELYGGLIHAISTHETRFGDTCARPQNENLF